jgi:Zinc finger, C3HC4 type (RING finger)
MGQHAPVSHNSLDLPLSVSPINVDTSSSSDPTTPDDCDEDLWEYICQNTLYSPHVLWALNGFLVVTLLHGQAAYGYLQREHDAAIEKLLAATKQGHTSVTGGVCNSSIILWGVLVVAAVGMGWHYFYKQPSSSMALCNQQRGVTMDQVKTLQEDRDETLAILTILQETHDHTRTELEALRQSHETFQQEARQRESSHLQQLTMAVEERDIIQQEWDRAQAEWREQMRVLTEHPPPPTCRICLDRRINTAMVPCGHTMCRECCDQILAHSFATAHIRGCPICRSYCQQSIQVHFA